MTKPDALSPEEIRRLREEADLSQYELAQRADLSRSTIQSAEHGRPIGAKSMRKLLRALRALPKPDEFEQIKHLAGSLLTEIDALQRASNHERTKVPA